MNTIFQNSYVTFTVPADFIVTSKVEDVIFKLRHQNHGILPEITIQARFLQQYQLPAIHRKNPFIDSWIPDKSVTDVFITKIKERYIRGYTMQAVIHSKKYDQLWSGPMRMTQFERFKDHWEVFISVRQRANDPVDPIALAEDLYRSITPTEKAFDYYCWYTDERRTTDVWPG
jgi:hypothetical protein